MSGAGGEAGAARRSTGGAAGDGYHGLCNICGAKDFFSARTGHGTRESFACPQCRATLRYRDQAALILDEFARGRAVYLHRLVASGMLEDKSIYEVARHGPFVGLFRRLPGYTRSYFWPDRPPGAVDEEGVRNEDLTCLTFPDNSFDMVITSDVMEHLLDYRRAFAEITRVLRPGGAHIFSIPTEWPFPERTESRVALVDGVETPIKPERYHRAGDGSRSLVYHDYGADLVEAIDATGCRTQVVRRHSSIFPCYVNATFVSRKLG